jgi:hypothetical protein
MHAMWRRRERERESCLVDGLMTLAPLVEVLASTAVMLILMRSNLRIWFIIIRCP